MKRYAGKHQKEPGHLTRDTTSPVDYVRSPEPGHEPTDGQGRRPWIIQRTGPSQPATPRTSQQSRPSAVQFAGTWET